MATIEKIDNILNIVYPENRDRYDPEQILKVMALFDTSHDFGKYHICYDTLSSSSRSNTEATLYKNQRMAFSALSKLVFDIGSDALSKKYGSLKTPAQSYSSALQAKDLENSFMLYAENYIKDNASGSIIRRTDVNGGGFITDTDYYDAVHDKLSDIYSNIIGNDNVLVPLLVDTQKKIYKHGTFKDQFMVPILRESVYDAAPKLKTHDTDKNVYYETGRNNSDSNGFYNYSNTIQQGGVFVGNIPVSLGPIDQAELSANKKYKIDVKINNGDAFQVIGNAAAKHINSINVLSREINGNQQNQCEQIGTTMYKLPQVETYPYSGYVTSDKNTSTPAAGCPNFNGNNNKFTQKRTGDGNQASICKLVNNDTVEIQVTNNNESTVTINRLVLVTIDRMLYAVALMLNIPVIFEHHKQESMRFYIPKPPHTGSSLGGGASINSNQKITNKPSLKSIIEPNNVSNNSLIQHTLQTGGSPFNLTYSTIFDDDESEYILNTPNYILALTPFIHSRASGKIKELFEAIVAQQYITCSNTVNGIGNPERTNFLRNSINNRDSYTVMNRLIGLDHNNIHIIDLQSGNARLIYKYNNYMGTHEDNGRVLYIESNGRTVARTETYDAFGKSRIETIFSTNVLSSEIYKQQTVEIIEDIMSDLNISEQSGGLSSSSQLTGPLGPEYDDIKTSDGNKTVLSKYPLLTKYNNYYAVAFNYVKTPEKPGQEINVELSNKFTLFAYLWMFNNYVIHVCIDDEETAIAYDEWTVKDDNRHVLVPTHKSLYLLFNYLVTTFKTENKLPFLLTDLEQVLYNENDYMYFQLQQIKDYVLKDDYISVIDINDKSSISKYSNYGDIKQLITDMNKKEVVVCEHMNKEDKFDELLKYAIDNVLTRYGMFYMNSDYLNYIGEDKKSKYDRIPNDSQGVFNILGGNRRKKSKKHKKIMKYKQTKRHIRRRNKKISTKRKKTRKKNQKTRRNSK